MRTRRVIAGAAAVVVLLLAWRFFRTENAPPARGQANDPNESAGSSSATRETAGEKSNDKSGDESAEAKKKRADEMMKRAIAMRKQIYEGLWRDEEDKSRGSVPDTNVPPPNAQTLDAKYIQERVRQDFFPMAKQCYADLLTRDPKANGRVVLSFRIVGDEKVGGVVDQSEIERDAGSITDSEMETCMRESMSSMTFAPPPHGGMTTVTYPILFAPDEPDGG